MDLGRSLVREGPEEPEIFLHVVGGSQRPIEAQSLFEANPLIAVVPKVFGILQEKPAAPFEDILLEKVGGFTIQITAQLGQLLVHELDHVEVVKHDGRMRQIASHRRDVSLGHVHGDGFDACSGGFESSPERLQCFGSFAFADEHHGPGNEVQNHRQVSMSATNADLIDGNPPEPFEGWLGEMPAEVSLLDLFDRMPTDPQMPSHILHGHVFGEVQHIPLKALGVPAIRFGKADLHLPSQPTNQTKHPLDRKLDDRRSQSDRKRDESPKDRPLLPNLTAATGGTRQSCRVLTNAEDRTPLIESRADIVNSPSRDSKTVIQ